MLRSKSRQQRYLVSKLVKHSKMRLIAKSDYVSPVAV
ncbi:MAG: hypothetical protein ACI9GB_003460 [Halioglobus sp.]